MSLRFVSLCLCLCICVSAWLHINRHFRVNAALDRPLLLQASTATFYTATLCTTVCTCVRQCFGSFCSHFHLFVNCTAGHGTPDHHRARTNEPTHPRTHARTHAHTHTRTHPHARTHAPTHTHAHRHTHGRTHARTHAHTHTHTHSAAVSGWFRPG